MHIKEICAINYIPGPILMFFFLFCLIWTDHFLLVSNECTEDGKEICRHVILFSIINI